MILRGRAITPIARATPAASTRSTADIANYGGLRGAPAKLVAPARIAQIRTILNDLAPGAIPPMPARDRAARRRSAPQNPSWADRSAASAHNDRARGAAATCRAQPSP